MVLAAATRFGRIQRLDDDLERWIAPHRTRLFQVARVASLLGEKFVHPVLAAACALTLMHARDGDPLQFILPLASASLGGIVTHHAVKLLYRRARPQVALERLKYEPAFPSGHTTNATAVLATGAYLFVHEGMLSTPIAAAIVIVLAACTGASRVVLGWHWGSDVIGGWLAGIGVSSLAASLYEFLRLRS